MIRLSDADGHFIAGFLAGEAHFWLRAVDARRQARAAGVPTQRAHMEQLVAEFGAAREYRPATFSPVGRPSRKGDTAAILRRWADQEPGRLSCTRYATARQPGWPTRNTIVRWFGSWDAALRAAGLADRAASSPAVRAARRAGGAAERAARTEAQRERVLATLRYGINIHGSVPTAMQFFRWRLVGAPATPTQATVYRLFPGGWAAVLEALEESSPGFMSTVPH